MRFDDAIEHEFHGVGIDPLVVELFASLFDCFDIFVAQFRRIQEIGNIEAHGKLFALAKLFE